MDELISFIRQLDRDNIRDYYFRFMEFLKNLEVENSKKYIDEYGFGIIIENICIIMTHNVHSVYIDILINKKCLYADDVGMLYGIADYENINDIIMTCQQDDGKYICIDDNFINMIDYGSIDWLLDHKSNKSARSSNVLVI